MENKACPIESLVTTEYCQLSVCMECRIVNLNLPGKISFQFEVNRFIEIANTFNQASQMLKSKSKKKYLIKTIEFNQMH